MLRSTVPDSAILYRLEPDPAAAGVPVGSASRAGLASFLRFAATLGVWPPLKVSTTAGVGAASEGGRAARGR